SSYFEWLGAGLYSPEHRSGAMHGRVYHLRELRYGFDEKRFCLRLDCFQGALAELESLEFRVTIRAADELTVIARIVKGKLVELSHICLLAPGKVVEVAFDRILEVAVQKEVMQLRGVQRLRVGVALWNGGLPVDVLPAEGYLDIPLGEEAFAWPIQSVL